MVAFLSGTVDDGSRRAEVGAEARRTIIVPAHNGMRMLIVVVRIGIANRRVTFNISGGTDVVGKSACASVD